MLLRHYGGALLTRSISRPSVMVTYSCLKPTVLRKKILWPLATFSMHSMSRSIRRGHKQVWDPGYGIVFNSSSSVSELGSSRDMSTFRTSISEHNLDLKSNVTGSCLPKSPQGFSSSISKQRRSPLWVRSSISENSWSSSGKSHDSEVSSLNANDASSMDINQEHLQELHTPLTYQIPKEILQKAKDALAGTKESFWSYKMYLGPENQVVKVHYCRSKNTAESVAQYFLNEGVLGFDIEWKPDATKNAGIKNNVALIQIASESRIALFHIAAFPKDTISGLVAPTLKKIMENANVTKVGVAIKADCTRLRNFLNIDSKGILELSHLYKLVKYSSSGNVSQINKRLVSLNTQAEEHLELPIFKGEVRSSDWTQSLSIEQIKYAASDAYANFMLYDALERKRKQLQPVPPRPYHAELDLPIRLASGAIISTKDDTPDEPDLNQMHIIDAHVSPASVMEAAAENVQIEDEAEPESTNSITRPKFKTQFTGSISRATTIPKPQLLIDAESWALSHRASNPLTLTPGKSSTGVTFSALRVYALWHCNSSLSIQSIGSMLRNPPLRNSTIAVYILDSVRLEKLPFEKERLKKVLQVVPDIQNMWRYKSLWKLVE